MLEKTGKFKNNADADAMYAYTTTRYKNKVVHRSWSAKTTKTTNVAFYRGAPVAENLQKRILHFARVGMTISTVMPFVRDFIVWVYSVYV